MNGITIDINPMIVHTGPFMLSWYSLFFMLAVVAGGWLGLREARRKGLDPSRVQSLILLSVLGGPVGARQFAVADRAGTSTRTNRFARYTCGRAGWRNRRQLEH